MTESSELALGSRIGSHRRLRLLVVDDDVRLRDVLRLVLSDKYDVDLAGSGADAIECMRRQRYDAVLCDLSMPQMSGSQVYERLEREDPDHARRMIVVTGGAFSPKARQFLRDTSCPSIRKPFAPPELDEAIDRIVRSCGMADLRRAG